MNRWGLAIVLAANAMLLVGVARNRWGGAQGTMELTERDLPVSQKGEENTALFLRLQWERSLPPERLQGSVLPQGVFVVLERRERLTAVDMDREADVLRQRYPDASRFAILRGTVRFSNRHIQIFPREIHVPPSCRSIFPAERYTVTLAFGARQEPWIVDCRRRP